MSDTGLRFNLLDAIKQPTMIFAIFLIVIVLMLIIPIPAFFLDFLISINIIASLLIILTVAYARRAVEFSIFPSLLLVTTIFRLSVNVSAARLILSQGAAFDGKMIRAFGKFVVGASDASGIVIGLIIFTILVIVQFVVITRGATRVAEVAARFSLDSMPNKYMAIDMDVQNGVIDEAEAIKRRQELQEESSFYGNMDGASKFVQGDVIVGIIITLVNIIGGFSVGILVRQETFDVALSTYTILTIGDGLVTQIPSLLVSTATGLIVTRSQAKDAIGTVAWKQITSQYKVFFIAGATMAVLALLPGFPHIILFVLAVAMIYAGYTLYNSERKETSIVDGKVVKKEEKEDQKGPENVASLLKVDPLSLYIGYELIPLVDKTRGAELLNSITSIRRGLAIDMGIVVPPIRIQDNMRLLPNEYSFKIRGQEVGKGQIKIGYFMAMGDISASDLEGEKTFEPAFGMPAIWIKEDLRERAESQGFTVVDAPTIISTHIQELLKEYASDILGREEITQILETVKKDYPTIVDDIQTDYKKARIQKILQELLKENVSIRDMATILETLSDHSSQTPLYELIEYIRIALKRVISNKYLDNEGKLHVLRFHPDIENEIYKNLSTNEEGMPLLSLKPDYIHILQGAIKDKIKEMFDKGYPPVILCQPPVRRAIWEISKHINKNIAIISTKELTSRLDVELFGQIILEVKEASRL